MACWRGVCKACRSRWQGQGHSQFDDNAPVELSGREEKTHIELLELCEQHGVDRLVQIGTSLELRLRLLPLQSPLVVERKGAALWPCSELLAHFVARRLSAACPCLSILELACGVAALPSLVASSLGSGLVVVADDAEVTTVTSMNAQANNLHVFPVALEWGDAASAADVIQAKKPSGFDLLLAADVLYDAGQHKALAKSLDSLAGRGARALFAERRWLTAGAFFGEALPAVGWTARRLSICDVFDAMGSTVGFRESHDIWACWREADGAPAPDCPMAGSALWAKSREEEDASMRSGPRRVVEVPRLLGLGLLAATAPVWQEADEPRQAPPEDDSTDEDEDSDEEPPDAPPE
ncbi:unnamed protein product [Polarella glacialis]|uniref:Calmodulin-lysine N-methyltransferase n=2 Tax=Polarella glacialis TaxID=89957 RepID=A0A813GBA3_POLGL|nr:unnamed protein product [Polarella glacialis]